MSVSGIALPRLNVALGDTAWRRRLSWALPLLPMWLSMLVMGIALLPEVTVAVPSLNDDAAHYSLILNASRALDAGQNIVDHWAPDLEVGYPQFAYYQHLPHLLVVALERLLLRQVELLTLFNLTRYVLLVAFPLTVYWSLRQFEFSRPAAGAAAAIAPLLSAGHRFGFEFDSYVWRGFGMYTQLWAMHLTFLSLALIHRTLRDGKGYFLSTLALSALVLSHVIYAFITGITVVFVLLAGLTRTNALTRITRLAVIGVPAVVITSYFWLPFILNGAFHATSPYMEDWKYDSHGAEQVMTWLVTGELLDHNRLPVVTAFGALGILAALWMRTRLAVLALAIFGFWLVAYFGRPTLGPVADVLSFDGKLWMHRFIGPVQLGAILLIAVGATGIWTLLHRLQTRLTRPSTQDPALATTRDARASRRWLRLPWPAAVFGLLVMIVAVTALAERWQYMDRNQQWIVETERALAADTELQAIIRELQGLPPGRVYAGVRSGFSETIKVGSLRIADVLTFHQIETAAPPYQSLSLNSDLVWHFDHQNLAHYEVFNARYVILPATEEAPDFTTPILSGERYQLLEVPSGGYLSLAETPSGFEGSEEEFHVAARSWFLGRAPGQGIYPALAIPEAPRLDGLDYRPMVSAPSMMRRLRPEHERDELGSVTGERATAFSYEASVQVDEPATLLLKATFHPDWRVYVNGNEVDPFMVAPSFPAIHLEPGGYEVRLLYEGNALRTPLLLVGALVLGMVAAGDRKRGWIEGRLKRLRRT